jgi:hypothetical protein
VVGPLGPPPDGETLVIAPQLHSRRLHHWLSSDEERIRSAARERLEATLAALAERGVRATGRLGDPDPLMALDDAYREFGPDEVVVSTHPRGRSQWLERQLVSRARERYPVPVTHLVVDLGRGTLEVDADPRRGLAGAPQALVTLFHSAPYEEALRIRGGGFRGVARGGMVQVRPEPPADDSDGVVFAVRVPAGEIAAYRGGEEGEMAVPAGLLDRHGPPVETDVSAVE